MNNNISDTYENQVLQVPIEDIIPNRFQPRLAFDDASLQDLAASIKQHGIIQPLVLRRKNDKYEIIAGERRYKAARMAGLLSVPAIISNLDDNASAEVAIVENVQRKDLTAIEEAKSYQALLDKGYMTQEELAKKMGLSQSAISNKLRLLTLDEDVQTAVLNEKISERHARTLLKVASHEKQRELLKKIINERLTVKQLEDYIKSSINPPATEERVKPEIEIPEPQEIKIEPTDSFRTQPNNKFFTFTQRPTVEEPPHIEEVKEIPKVEEPIEEEVIIPVNVDPDIDNIKNNSVDITPISEPESLEELDVLEPLSVNPNSFFGTPEKVSTKFFNALEDTAVNMNIQDITPTFTTEETLEDTTDLLNKTDNIEMLDDFVIADNTSTNNDYLDYVIKTIRGLNLDSNKVTIKEINLPTEYQINIKINKDVI